ncbi:MAG: DUF393 domain-containing protein [Chloroflexi bacterium]|nr:MAG: DUF393 domain-containing protein [Chloroflexota bacterium]TMD52496.1 MAG: DUF393 domain-containing protein [Chloroflexota bacterium]
MRWLRARDRAGRVSALPNQIPGLRARFGLTKRDVRRTAWTIDGEGTRLSGARAINRVLRELGGGWRLLSAVLGAAPIVWLEDAIYSMVARHRHALSRWWSTQPECDRPDVDCE